MFTRIHICLFLFALAAAPVAAQTSSALPADRLQLANQLLKRGLESEALREYEAVRGADGVPQDLVLYRIGEICRGLPKPRVADALAAYDELVRKFPVSKYADYARLGRAVLLAEPQRSAALLELDRRETPPDVRANALYRLGEANEKARRTAEAADFYRRAADAAPDGEIARFARLRAASMLASSGRSSDRRSSQQVYLDLAESPDAKVAEEALFFAAMLSYRDRRYAEASALFSRLSSRFPDGAHAGEAATYAAWANYLCGKHVESLRLASALRGRGNEDADYLAAASLKALGRTAEALAAYREYLAAHPSGRHADAAWAERLGALAALGDSRGVLDELSRRAEPPAKSAALAWSHGCEAAIAVTNFPLAIEYARLVVGCKDSPQAPNATYRLAWLLEQTKDWSKAAAAYRILARHWPDGPLAAQALFQAGVDEIKGGRADRACADWTDLLAKYPDSRHAPEALYARAMEEIRRKEYRAAEKSLSERFRRFPDAGRRPEALYWWGVAAKGMDDDPEAERHFRAALEAAPTAELEREAKLELASVLQRRGKNAEAAAVFAGLLETKAVDRLTPATLAWVAESMLETTNGAAAALAAAQVVERRKVDAAWTQTGAELAGEAHEALGEGDAAAAAYERALKTGARTVAGIKAALALGRLETGKGLFDEAKAHLSDAVERSKSQERLAFRVRAYAALARNEEERGDAAAALGYHLLVGTLFDDRETVPRSLARAAAIMKEQGKAEESAKLLEELKTRYPDAATE